MADPFVDEFHSRDLDAKILQREVDAVNEWKATNFTFHVMRDHPHHGTGILSQCSLWQHGLRPKISSSVSFAIDETTSMLNYIYKRKLETSDKL